MDSRTRTLPVAASPAVRPTRRLSGRNVFAAAVFLLLALVPPIALAMQQPVYLTLGSRIMIFALAAVGLNLVLGYGAMVSFGHALYLGLGAYAVGILSAHGVTNGFAHLGVALGVGAVVSAAVGLVCLRTSGIAFIMITLAFAQMFYYLAVGLKTYGGDDGLPIIHRSDFGVVNLADGATFYYAIFAVLGLVVWALQRLVNARFGMVLQGLKSNERRMRALGFSPLRYKLTAYVISALICVVAGVMLANLAKFASPSYMQWSVSGDLIVMVVLGGLGTLIGPVIGAAVLLLLEEVLTSTRLGLPWGLDDAVRDHWQLALGAFVVIVTLTLNQGLYGHLRGRER